MKKITLILAILCAGLGATAQTEQGNFYLGAGSQLSGGITTVDNAKGSIKSVNLALAGGTFLFDNLMLGLNLGLERADTRQVLSGSPMARAYFNETFAGVNYVYSQSKFGDSKSDFHSLGIELGQAFFVRDIFAVEPALYFNRGLGDFNQASTFGIKIGLGLYL